MARRSEHSRDEIQAMAIQAAIHILSEDGLQGLSTRKVASAIGYTAGTLYLVFKNLDELILQVNAASLDELHGQMQNALAKNKEPQTQLLGLAHAYLCFARDNFARWSLMFTHQMPADMDLPDWFHDKVRVLFALVVQPLQEINASLTPEQYQQATHVLWSSVHGVCELGLNDKLALGGEIRAEELIDAMLKNFLNGFIQGWK